MKKNEIIQLFKIDGVRKYIIYNELNSSPTTMKGFLNDLQITLNHFIINDQLNSLQDKELREKVLNYLIERGL